ncbi:MAG: bacterial transcriptional activator domain-containing protein [Armatimonadetes bacterium]|nr:bacterial transcriptional activator domain-containing protein [Armatimonadota bacterium]
MRREQSLRSAAVATEPVARAQHLRTALALYKGEFASGFYLDVLLTERERLSMLAQSARERLTELEGTHPTEAALPLATVVPAVSLHPTNAFFGRRAERDHLAFLLMEHRLVTLLGPGGTGKIRRIRCWCWITSSSSLPLAAPKHSVPLPGT